MKDMSREKALEILSLPNGSEKLYEKAVEAFPAAWALFAGEGDKRACAFLCRCAKRQAFRERMNELLGENREALRSALESDEPKLRQNAARLAGELGREEDVRFIVRALMREETRFVRPSMLLAIGAVGGDEAEAFLNNYVVAPPKNENEKRNFEDERAALADAKKRFVKLEKHTFTGLVKPFDMELRTPRQLSGSLVYELGEMSVRPEKELASAVVVKGRDVEALFSLRSFFELLFPIARNIPIDAKRIAGLAGPFLAELMTSSHSGRPPYGYRVEIRGESAERAKLAKAVSALVDSDVLVNSPGNYEAELRIEPDEHNKCAVYAKLYTVPDERFSYRKESLPASINPATAAAVVRYARDYLTPGARVIDPCCGSGTMLFERERFIETQSATGVDIAHKAIDIARANAALAGSKAKFIVNDIRRFEATRPYDELITNLPFGNRVGSHADNVSLYEYLVDALPRLLVRGGTAIMYTMEFTLLKKLVRARPNLELAAEARTEAGGLTPEIFIIKVKS